MERARFNMLLMTMFALCALMLAAIGIYGLIAYAAADSSEAWSSVVAHLSDGRPGHRGKGAADREIAWTIQNARVVLQSIQARSNPRIRDRSMAENVKWILDENPGAKIALWAHNGHVSKAGSGASCWGAS